MTGPKTRTGPALIVGGSTGIGLAIAREFAAQGHDLLLIARDAGQLTEAADDLRTAFPVGVHTLALDATADDAPARALAHLDTLGLPLDYAVVGLGTWQEGPLIDLLPADLRRLLDVNVVAQHAWQRALANRLPAGGGVLAVGSLAGLQTMPGMSAYAASKAGLHACTLALREEAASRGVGVSLLAPGAVRTRFLALDAHSRRGRLLDWFGSSPETVAHAAVLGLKSNTAVIVPGVLWRLLWFALKVLPAWVGNRLMHGFLRMTAPAVAASPAPTGRS